MVKRFALLHFYCAPHPHFAIIKAKPARKDAPVSVCTDTGATPSNGAQQKSSQAAPHAPACPHGKTARATAQAAPPHWLRDLLRLHPHPPR